MAVFDSEKMPTSLTRFVYGTTRLGDSALTIGERLKMARHAMETGVWFHTSEQYGDALSVLGKAFAEARAQTPKLIVKLGNDSIEEIRDCIRRNVEPLGVDAIDIGQLCLGPALAQEFADGQKCYDAFASMRAEGLVKQFVLEVFPWTSEAPLSALQAGHADSAIVGVIFYFNPLQRFVSNALWSVLRERQVPVLALRTVAGGDVHRLRDVPGAAWKPYLQERATQVAPIFENSGARSWTDFCVRFAFSFPTVRSTIGATSLPARLDDFVRTSAGTTQPLSSDVLDELLALQARWAVETDAKAKPWSM